jgi:pimeloyl-ACP methyl ester carboxylesterase
VLVTAVLRAGFLAVLVGIFIAIIALAGDSAGGTRPAGREAKAFRESTCQFEIPVGAEVTCGQVRLPEDRRHGERDITVNVAVAIFESRGRGEFPDPVVYLEGGPGYSPMADLEYSYPYLVAPFVTDRDVIVVDQRGTGASGASLDCWEFEAYAYEAEGATQEELIRREVRAANDCARRLRNEESVSLENYTTLDIAADIAELREALGYEEWNLFGVSYGTNLALTVMRDFPEGVRSVILDSAYPLEVDLYETRSENAARALNLLFGECEKSSFCGDYYPDLSGEFRRTVRRLRNNPETVPNEIGARFFGPEEYYVDDAAFISAVYSAMYSNETNYSVPEMILQASEGEYGLVLEAMLTNQYQSFSFSYGMHLAVQCSGEAPFTSREAVEESLKSHPDLRNYFEREAELVRRTCPLWAPYEPDARENQAVRSDIPTLVLAGELDPVTPPEWGQKVHESLENSYFYTFPGMGHGVALSTSCSFEITRDFLNDPGDEPDSTCIDKMNGIEF